MLRPAAVGLRGLPNSALLIRGSEERVHCGTAFQLALAQEGRPQVGPSSFRIE